MSFQAMRTMYVCACAPGLLRQRRGMAAGAVAAALLLSLALMSRDRGPTWVAAAVPHKVRLHIIPGEPECCEL